MGVTAGQAKVRCVRHSTHVPFMLTCVHFAERTRAQEWMKVCGGQISGCADGMNDHGCACVCVRESLLTAERRRGALKNGRCLQQMIHFSPPHVLIATHVLCVSRFVPVPLYLAHLCFPVERMLLSHCKHWVNFLHSLENDLPS